MEYVEGGTHVLCLAKHERVAASLGAAVSNVLTPGASGGLVTIPIMSALSVCFPGASCVSVSVDLGNGLLATVGNMLVVGPVNVGFSNVKDTVAGLAARESAGVSTTTKAGRMAMVTGLRCDSGCTLVTSVPVLEAPISAASDANYPLWGHGRCIGSVTLAFPRSQCAALQDMYLSNQRILAAALGMHIASAARALQCTASALAGTPLSPATPISPGSLLPPRASLHVDAHAMLNATPAAPEDVEAEQSYSDLDEEYRRELVRECGSTTSSCVGDEEEDVPTHAPPAMTKQQPQGWDGKRVTPIATRWLHLVAALLLALVLRNDLVVYGMMAFGVLAAWVVTAIRDNVAPAGWEVALVALSHGLACVVPTPIWRDWHGGVWMQWMQRMLADPAAMLLAYTVAVTTVISVMYARRRMGCARSFSQV